MRASRPVWRGRPGSPPVWWGGLGARRGRRRSAGQARRCPPAAETRPGAPRPPADDGRGKDGPNDPSGAPWSPIACRATDVPRPSDTAEGVAPEPGPDAVSGGLLPEASTAEVTHGKPGGSGGGRCARPDRADRGAPVLPLDRPLRD